MAVIDINTTPFVVEEELLQSPMGWDELGIQFMRNWTYMSLLRNLSLALRFPRIVGGGFDFIKNAYDTDGIYALIGVTIKKRNPATNGYEFYYSGIFDMKPNRFKFERNFIEAPIIDNQKLQRFKDRDESEIDLFAVKTIDNANVTSFINEKSITLTPIDIYREVEADCEWTENREWTDEFEDWQYFFYQNAVYIKQGITGVNLDNVKEIYYNDTANDVNLTISITTQYDVNVVLTSEYYVSTSLSWIINIYNPSEDVASYLLYNRRADLANTPDLGGTLISNYNWGDNFSANYTFTIKPGGYIDSYCGYRKTGNPAATINFTKHEVTHIEISEFSPGKVSTTTKCFFPFEAFSRALQIITSEQKTAKILDSTIFGRTDSEFIKYSSFGDASLMAIFSGRMCRNYPDAPLVVKFKDLFNTFKSIYNIGLGYDNVNDRFYIEKVENFFDASYQMFDLGEVSKLTISPLTEGYFNKITAGFDNDGDYEELQGAYEFNVKREYSTASPVKEEKDIEAKYRADSVGIELIRDKQFIDNSSEDHRDDKTVFVVKTNGSYPILDTSATGFAGIEKYYNLMLTPRQNAIRNGNILSTTLYKSNLPVKAQSTSKLFNLYVNGIDENSDIQKNELGESLFIPELYTFESYINTQIINILLTNPHGFIKFSNFGESYEGYLMDLSGKDYKKPSTYTLIAKAISTNENKIFEDGENFIFEDGENFIFE